MYVGGSGDTGTLMWYLLQLATRQHRCSSGARTMKVAIKRAFMHPEKESSVQGCHVTWIRRRPKALDEIKQALIEKSWMLQGHMDAAGVCHAWALGLYSQKEASGLLGALSIRFESRQQSGVNWKLLQWLFWCTHNILVYDVRWKLLQWLFWCTHNILVYDVPCHML